MILIILYRKLIMSTSLGIVPLDVYSKEIIPHIGGLGAYCFGLACKEAYALIFRLASEPQQDCDLNGNRITFWFRDPSTRFEMYISHLFKKQNLPLNPFPAAIEAKDQHLVEELFPQSGIQIVLYTPLLAAIQSNDKKTLERLLKLPNATICTSWLPDLLIESIRAKSFESFQTLLSLPNAQEIPAKQFDAVLKVAHAAEDTTFLQHMLFHPTAEIILGADTLTTILADSIEKIKL